MYPVTLTGAKVRLREFALTDIDAALQVVGDPRVTDWLSFDVRSADQTRSMIQGIVNRARDNDRTEYYLAMTRLDSTNLIGFARLGLSGVKAAKLGFAIAADQWGHGYATDAARTLIAFGFAELGLHRITAAIGPENMASIALVTRLGFQPEGRLRDHVFTSGSWRDSILYAILESESPTGGVPGSTSEPPKL